MKKLMGTLALSLAMSVTAQAASSRMTSSDVRTREGMEDAITYLADYCAENRDYCEEVAATMFPFVPPEYIDEAFDAWLGADLIRVRK